MTDPTQATRATVTIGSIEVDGFQLPDGTYRMSQAQAAEAIEEPPVYALGLTPGNCRGRDVSPKRPYRGFARLSPTQTDE
ncbi:MAG: hypothetical protein SVX43_10985 [Cyanobacteriota bacterium]|nr:hypothetical protein [Cyanobacteriota bacterium]